jgi:hypothetical protein
LKKTVRVQGRLRASVRDSEISQNSTAGIAESIVTSRPPIVTVVGTTFEDNIVALQSTIGASITASGNTFADNSTVYDLNGGQIFTGNDNVSNGNTTVGATSGTSALNRKHASHLRRRKIASVTVALPNALGSATLSAVMVNWFGDRTDMGAV